MRTELTNIKEDCDDLRESSNDNKDIKKLLRSKSNSNNTICANNKRVNSNKSIQIKKKNDYKDIYDTINKDNDCDAKFKSSNILDKLLKGNKNEIIDETSDNNRIGEIILHKEVVKNEAQLPVIKEQSQIEDTNRANLLNPILPHRIKDDKTNTFVNKLCVPPELEFVGHKRKKKSQINLINKSNVELLILTIGDLIQSIGILVTSLIIYFFPTFDFLDSIITIIFCFLIGYSLIPILTKCTIVLMEGKPVGVDYRKIKQIIENVF